MELRVPEISSALSYRLFLPASPLAGGSVPLQFLNSVLLLFNLLSLIWYLLYISLPRSLASPPRGLSRSLSLPPPICVSLCGQHFSVRQKEHCKMTIEISGRKFTTRQATRGLNCVLSPPTLLTPRMCVCVCFCVCVCVHTCVCSCFCKCVWLRSALERHELIMYVSFS